MENNDFCYILMSSLKHPYREHMTKESTSLLMKELDQAAACASHHHQPSSRQQCAINSSAGGGGGNGASCSSSSSVINTNHHQHRPHHLNYHQQRQWEGDLQFGSPKSPENVARTILRAFGGGDERQRRISKLAAAQQQQQQRRVATATSARLDNGGGGGGRLEEKSARSTSSSGASISTAINGNNNNNNNDTNYLSNNRKNHHKQQPASILTRCRRKLHLQLSKLNGDAHTGSPPRKESNGGGGNGSERKKRQSVVVLATNGDRHHHGPGSSADEESLLSPRAPPVVIESPTRGFVLVEAGEDPRNGCVLPVHDQRTTKSSRYDWNCSGEEHRLIAYNSSLLLVKPTMTNATSPPASGPSTSPSDSSSDSFAHPPPPPPSHHQSHLQPPMELFGDDADLLQETAILDSETSSLTGTRDLSGATTTGEHHLHSEDISTSPPDSGRVEIEYHAPPTQAPPPPPSRDDGRTSPGSEHISEMMTMLRVNTGGGGGGTGGVALASSGSPQQPQGPGTLTISTDSVTPVTTGSSLQRIHNRMCTSYRLKAPLVKNPVDLCLLPNDDIAIADYDNGLLIVNDLGETIEHKKTFHEVNACGVACLRGTPSSPAFRIFLLVVRDGVWTVNVYRNYELIEMARCPNDAQIENWALRRLVVCVDSRLHLLASGETKSIIWTYEFEHGEWRVLLSEMASSRKATSGVYNDMSVKFDKNTNETRLVLCEWRKAQLWTLYLNERTDVVEEKSIKMKRVKGQEWIVQGPHLAVLDQQGDILVYDGSGKLFLFDGGSYRCKKIVADLGRGEVSALCAHDGWLFALCRYKKCIEAYMYKENNETSI